MPLDAQQESGQGRSRWSLAPRWYLWDGGFLAIGKSEGIVPPHAHHAIQIVFAIEGDVAVKGKAGNWRTGRGVIVRQDAEHSYDGKNAIGAMLFVDPESTEGAWLRTALADEVTIVPDARLTDSISALRTFCERPFESMELRELIRHCVVSLLTRTFYQMFGIPPSVMMRGEFFEIASPFSITG